MVMALALALALKNSAQNTARDQGLVTSDWVR